jgi:hypothetical protein
MFRRHFSAPTLNCGRRINMYSHQGLKSQNDLSLFCVYIAGRALKRVKMAWELSHSAKQISSFMMQKKVLSTKSLLFSTPYELDVAQ